MKVMSIIVTGFTNGKKKKDSPSISNAENVQLLLQFTLQI